MSTNSTMLQITKGLQSIPIIGGFIPDYRNDTPSTNEIREMMNKAYQHLNQLNANERAKLAKLTEQLEDYGQLIGSPSLMAFAKSRKEEITKQINNIEQKITDIDNAKQDVSIKADDVINAYGTPDQFRDSKLFKNLEQTVANVEKIN